MDKNEIGRSIKHNREKLGLTQTELAKRLNTTRQCISSWEIGRTQPDVASIEKLSQVLGCPVPVMMGMSRGEISIQEIEERMKLLDVAALDRIKKYADYLISTHSEPTDEDIHKVFKDLM